MKIIKNYKDIDDIDRGSVIAIGNFDGIHNGHKALVDNIIGLSKIKGKKAGICTFNPHPKNYFANGQGISQITPQELKYEIFEKLGIDILYEVEFNYELSIMSPAEFFNNILINGLGAVHVTVGSDFKFGHKRSGDASYLNKQCDAHNIGFQSIEKQMDSRSQIYSSSRIRDFISRGDIVNATNFLGYYWFIDGVVLKGQNKGTDMGFPTVNLSLNKSINLAHGIYATNIYISGQKYGGASYFGTRPTFEGDEEFLETYIFDFNEDLYGRSVRVEFIDFVRGDMKFSDDVELTQQMEIDCDNVLNKLQNYDKNLSLLETQTI